jgi:hypothetical protein
MAAIIASIRKHGAKTVVDNGGKSQFTQLTERLPPAESREVDIEIGMLLIGYESISAPYISHNSLHFTCNTEFGIKRDL